jgi:hypothetical protein
MENRVNPRLLDRQCFHGETVVGGCIGYEEDPIPTWGCKARQFAVKTAPGECECGFRQLFKNGHDTNPRLHTGEARRSWCSTIDRFLNSGCMAVQNRFGSVITSPPPREAEALRSNWSIGLRGCVKSQERRDLARRRSMHEPPPVTRRTAQLAAGRQQSPDDLPFRIRQVARVHTTTPLRTSLIYPQHRFFTQPLRPHQ